MKTHLQILWSVNLFKIKYIYAQENTNNNLTGYSNGTILNKQTNKRKQLVIYLCTICGLSEQNYLDVSHIYL